MEHYVIIKMDLIKNKILQKNANFLKIPTKDCANSYLNGLSENFGVIIIKKYRDFVKGGTIKQRR